MSTDTTDESITRLPFERTYLLGRVADGKVWVKVKWKGDNLSLTGVIGPKVNGDATGSCGQILDHLTDVRGGWPADDVNALRALWDRWHLNTLRAGCEHQRAAKWDERPIDPAKPLRAYGRHFPGQQQDTWNMLTWIRPSEHPDGLLTKECEVCGYAYGSAWLTEDVPTAVLAQLRAFPEAAERCPWGNL